MGQICLGHWVSHPAFMWLWRVGPKLPCLQWLHQSSLSSQWTELPSHLPKIFLYILGLNFSGIQEVQQYGRVGRNGMSPIRDMCTASKLFFFPILEILEDLCWTASTLKKKKKSIFKWPVTVSRTWIGKWASSAANNIYDVVPGACKNSRIKFYTGTTGFVTSFTSSRSQVPLPWQQSCIRAEKVILPVITKGLVWMYFTEDTLFKAQSQAWYERVDVRSKFFLCLSHRTAVQFLGKSGQISFNQLPLRKKWR